MPPRHVANFKLRMCAAEPFHLPKIVDLIGCNTQKSAFFQRGGDRIQKVARKNPATLTPPLRPRVWKQTVKRFH